MLKKDLKCQKKQQVIKLIIDIFSNEDEYLKMVQEFELEQEKIVESYCNEFIEFYYFNYLIHLKQDVFMGYFGDEFD